MARSFGCSARKPIRAARHVALDHAVAEFFTLRKCRRAGVGSRAAQLLFDRLPGSWEVPVAAYNTGAIAFWRALAVRMPLHVEECAGDGTRWHGPVLHFTAGGA